MFRKLAVVGSIFCCTGLAHAQTCHDWDGDGALAGADCVTATDCEDLSWALRPGASEVCDGYDNDCDGDLDAGCSRTCDQTFLFSPATLLDSGDPMGRPDDPGCSAFTEKGLLVGHEVLVGGSLDKLIRLRAYDALGQPLGSSDWVGFPATVNPREGLCKISAAGDRALIVWRDSRATENKLWYRVVDSVGDPLSDALLLSSSDSWLDHEIVWDGDRFVVFWVRGDVRNRLMMTTISPDAPEQNSSTVVTSNVDGTARDIDDIAAVFLGDQYYVATALPGSIRVLQVSRQGVPAASPTTALEEAVIDFAMAAGGGQIALAWTNASIPEDAIRTALLDSAGILVDPPGPIGQNAGFNNDFPFVIHLAWNGEHFGQIAAVQGSSGPGFTYTWFFWRYSAAGAYIAPSPVQLATGPNLPSINSLAWRGDEFQVVTLRDSTSQNRVHLERVVCSCVDLDEDGFSACFQSDCDDDNPQAFVGATETCRGLEDEDCDGLVDCEDPSCAVGSFPGEITSLDWHSGSLLWTAVPGAQRYDLARGLASELHRRADFALSECAGSELTVPEWQDDGRVPPAGDALWFTVRPEGAPCELGAWGHAAVQREIRSCR